MTYGPASFIVPVESSLTQYRYLKPAHRSTLHSSSPPSKQIDCHLQEANSQWPEYEEVARHEFARFALGYIATPLAEWLRLEDKEVRPLAVLPGWLTPE